MVFYLVPTTMTEGRHYYLANIIFLCVFIDVQRGFGHVGTRTLLPTNMSGVPGRVCGRCTCACGDRHGWQGLGWGCHAVSSNSAMHVPISIISEAAYYLNCGSHLSSSVIETSCREALHFVVTLPITLL